MPSVVEVYAVGGIIVVLVASIVVALLAIAGGATRRAKRKDALRRIEKVNDGGYLDDLGTVMIDTRRVPLPPKISAQGGGTE